jgi:hypothetical protein
MSSLYQIQNTSCGPLGTANGISISVNNFNILDSECVVSYTLLDTNNKKRIGDGFLRMTGSTYDNWGQDNTYVKNFVFTQLNLVDA